MVEEIIEVAAEVLETAAESKKGCGFIIVALILVGIGVLIWYSCS